MPGHSPSKASDHNQEEIKDFSRKIKSACGHLTKLKNNTAFLKLVHHETIKDVYEQLCGSDLNSTATVSVTPSPIKPFWCSACWTPCPGC